MASENKYDNEGYIKHDQSEYESAIHVKSTNVDSEGYDYVHPPQTYTKLSVPKYLELTNSLSTTNKDKDETRISSTEATPTYERVHSHHGGSVQDDYHYIEVAAPADAEHILTRHGRPVQDDYGYIEAAPAVEDYATIDPQQLHKHDKYDTIDPHNYSTISRSSATLSSRCCIIIVGIIVLTILATMASVVAYLMLKTGESFTYSIFKTQGGSSPNFW